MLERHGIAHLIHKTDLLKPEELKTAILKVLNDPRLERIMMTGDKYHFYIAIKKMRRG